MGFFADRRGSKYKQEPTAGTEKKVTMVQRRGSGVASGIGAVRGTLARRGYAALANTAPPLRKQAMGLFANRRRSKVRQEPIAGMAGIVAPTKQKPEGAVSYEDFKAEVIAAGLAADWTERRLQLQFQAIDENGDGWVELGQYALC